MLILSIDSTAQTASATLSDDEKFLAGVTLNVGNKHSTTLLPAVSFVLEQAGRTVSDVKLIALTAGPGSFTGVRIGAAAVKGLALGRNIPCIGVSSLETMAEGFAFGAGLICPMINARRDRYFTALFTAENGAVRRLSDDDTLPGDEIDRILAAQTKPVWLTGDGAEIYLKSHSAVTPMCTPELLKYPAAYYAGVIAKRIWDRAGKEERSDFTAEAVRPIYLRQPQAERELEERMNINK